MQPLAKLRGVHPALPGGEHLDHLQRPGGGFDEFLAHRRHSMRLARC